jgi:isopentenyl-diphosphate delta-isomerase
MSNDEALILVNDADEEIGTGEKLDIHRKGQLHRAFSVFVLDSQDRVLLQRRAGGKYHSGGLWSNTCCGHPRPGEETRIAAERRLREEMGIECQLTETGAFTYRVELDRGLIEHEIDHVFSGEFSGSPSPNPDEVSDWKWISLRDLESWMEREPDQFTRWFPFALKNLSR